MNIALASDLVWNPDMVGTAIGFLILGGNIFGSLVPIATGDVKSAEDTADKVAASTTFGGMLVIQAGGDVKKAADAAAIEQLGTSALKREVFKDAIENALAFYDLVTGKKE